MKIILLLIFGYSSKASKNYVMDILTRKYFLPFFIIKFLYHMHQLKMKYVKVILTVLSKCEINSYQQKEKQIISF